jgi:hypothetical protein
MMRARLRWGVLVLSVAAWHATGLAGIGVNKFDIVQQYYGTANGGDGSETYRKVTLALARKAMADARLAAIPYFRFGASGYAPSVHGARGDLDLWLARPSAYWEVYDSLMDDLAAHGIRAIPSFIWNTRQMPSIVDESVRDLVTNPRSRSYQLLAQYVGEFVARYRGHPALEAYEVGNEFNLYADLDMLARCAARWGRDRCRSQGNYSTDEMIAFTGRLARLIRTLDPSRPISAGHSFPRPAAQHLRRQPEFSTRGADWTEDSEAELSAYLRQLHADFELLSIHTYTTEPLPSYFKGDYVRQISFAADVARRTGKRLFIGETGERTTEGLKAGSFLDRALKAARQEGVAYTLLWAWQFYHLSTYRTYDNVHTYSNIEPGRNDELIARIAAANGTRYPRVSTGPDTQPPQIVITWPLQCAQVAGRIEVHVTASDDAGRSPEVALHAGGRRIPLGSRPPYMASVEGLGVGEVEIEAVAMDAAGNRATWPLTVLAGGEAPGARCAR